MKRLFLIGLLLVAGAMAAFAQKEGTKDKHDETVTFRPHWFMRVQGGVGYTLGENDFGKLTSPAAALQAGYRFTPVWGLRFGLSGWQGKGSWVAPRTDYDFNYLQLGADAVVDLGNWIGGFNYRRFWNPYLFAGVGGAMGFNNDGAQALADAGNVTGIMTTMMIQDIFLPESPSSSVNITSTVPMMSRTTIMYPISETIPIADTVSVSYQSGNQRGRSAGNHLHLDIVAGHMPA